MRHDRFTIDVRQENGVLDVTVGMDADVGAQDGMRYPPSRDDTPHGDDGIGGRSHAPFFREDELGGRELRLVGAQGPLRVVEVEDGIDLHEVHGRLVVGVERPDISPVLGSLPVLVPEDVGVDGLARVHEGGE